MQGTTKLSELTVDEYKFLAGELLKDIPPDHFMEAVDKMFWKNTRQLGIEVTGKDITKVNDVLCIRKTFDESQKCRIKKEKIKDTLITDGVKRLSNFFFTLLALGLAAWVAATK